MPLRPHTSHGQHCTQPTQQSAQTLISTALNVNLCRPRPSEHDGDHIGTLKCAADQHTAVYACGCTSTPSSSFLSWDSLAIPLTASTAATISASCATATQLLTTQHADWSRQQCNKADGSKQKWKSPVATTRMLQLRILKGVSLSHGLTTHTVPDQD